MGTPGRLSHHIGFLGHADEEQLQAVMDETRGIFGMFHHSN